MAPQRYPRLPVRLVGRSAQMALLRTEIERVARTDAKVLVGGESGVGKEIVARMIHADGPRSLMMFAPVNCAGLPETLLESELFGHEKGSFTGAYRDRPGKLETAHMGTVFLDEIGEMTLRMQGLLLRFLETGEVQRLGSDSGPRHVNVRIIGATHRNLHEMIAQGAFREDLYYRLNVIQIAVPPLRAHKEDIPDLFHYFLNRFVPINRSPITSVSPEAMQALMSYSWPGNVRELSNLSERMAVGVQHEGIELEDLPAEMRGCRHDASAPAPPPRSSISDELYVKLTQERESFWAAVYPLYMSRDITRADLREIVRRGLEEARGNYKVVARLFNMEPRDYKRFLNFLRKHDCQLSFKEYR